MFFSDIPPLFHSSLSSGPVYRGFNSSGRSYKPNRRGLSLSLSLIHFRIKVCRTRLLQQVSTTHRRSLQIRRRTIPQRRRRLARRCKLCRADCAAGNQAPRARESQVFRVNRWQSFPESRDDRGPSKEANSIGQRRRNENIGKIKKKIVDKKREERWKGKKIKNRERAQGS